jgi:poly(ADP-ribose) glycohydrolase ARH3
MIPNISACDRIRGALVGTVVGDAFGNPLEGAPASTLQTQLTRRAKQAAPWRYTDDGATTIAVAESIRETGTVNPVNLLSKLRAHYEPARGFGRGMKLALAAFDRGVPWTDVASAAWPEGSRGNGGAVRGGVVAFRAWVDSSSLRSAAALATRVTHSHHEAINAALVQVSVVALVLQEPGLVDAPFELLQRAASVLDGEPACLSIVETLADVTMLEPSTAEIARRFGVSPLAVESVPAAIASFLRYHANFEDAIVHAAALGGDVDSICALVGCLAGASHGFSGIPKLWLDALSSETPSLTALCNLADDIAALAPAPFNEGDA